VKSLDTHQSGVNKLKAKRVKKSIYSISSDAVVDAVKIDIFRDRKEVFYMHVKSLIRFVGFKQQFLVSTLR
jgi:hypothetical protein